MSTRLKNHVLGGVMIINGVIDAAASQWQEIGDVDRERKVCPYSMSLYCTMEAEG